MLKLSSETSSFKPFFMDNNDKFDVISYIVWTSEGAVHIGPHAVHGSHSPTCYISIDQWTSRRSGLKVIPFCLGKACSTFLSIAELATGLMMCIFS